ncbi:MAG: hypothetical protein DWQ37_04330 [Planctomycetota bacterium]|nr:MAG: hypothetical protein DWQ37_04330 [Planctomycetota bacterium]
MIRVELSGGEVELDDNIARLVRACDQLPGLSTTSSCGGHESPNAEHGQQPLGQFYVSLCVANWWEAWRGLTMLTAATFMRCEGNLCFRYDGPQNRPDDLRFLRVELHGTGDPDRLAKFVEYVVDDPAHHTASN